MKNTKKYPYVITVFLITSSLQFYQLEAKENSKQTHSDKQSSQSQKKLDSSSFTIKEAKTTHGQTGSEQIKNGEKKGKVTIEKQPSLSIDSPSYDAGAVWEGDEVIHTFTIKNTGTAQLDIKKVKGG